MYECVFLVVYLLGIMIYVESGLFKLDNWNMGLVKFKFKFFMYRS